NNVQIANLLPVDASSVSRYLKQAEESGWLQQKVQVRLPRDLERAAQATVRALKTEDALFQLFSRTRGSSAPELAFQRENFIVVKPADDGVEARKTARMKERRTRGEELDTVGLTMRGIEGARLLIDVLSAGQRAESTVLGIAWGRGAVGVNSHCGDVSSAVARDWRMVVF